MYGLIDIQRSLDDSAVQGFSNAAKNEKNRNIANQQLDAQKKSGMMGALGTGAGVGASVGGPVGAGIGAGIGLLAYSLF